MATDPMERCFICSDPGKLESHPQSRNLLVHDCKCGRYLIQRHDKTARFNKAGDEAVPKLTALIKEQTIKGLAPLYLQWHDQDHSYPLIDDTFPVDVPNLLNSQFPQDVPQLIDRSLANLARMSKEAGQEIEIDRSDP